MGGRLGSKCVRSIDDAVARRVDRNGDGPGGFSGDPEDNFFYLTDVMFSVRAIVDGAGRLHTRLDYTPYGVAMHGFAADVNGDGVLSFTDLVAFNTVYNGGTALRPGATGYDPDADLSGSGAMDSGDSAAFTARYIAYAAGGSNATFNAGWIDNPGDPNGPDNSVGYDGYWFDLAGATEATSSGLYMVRHRVYDPRLGRWLQRDPVENLDGMSLYQYCRSNAVSLIDPRGTQSEPGTGLYIPGYIDNFEIIFAPHDEYPRHGISIGIITTLLRDKFKEDQCCDSVGYVQIVKSKKVSGDIPGPPGKWVIDGHPGDGDGSIFPFYYLEDKDGTVWTTYPNPARPLSPSMVDAPVYRKHVGSSDQSMEFETCLVCKSGPHKCQVYGCIQWGWEREGNQLRYWARGGRDGGGTWTRTFNRPSDKNSPVDPFGLKPLAPSTDITRLIQGSCRV